MIVVPDTDKNVCVSELSDIIHNVALPLFKRNMLPTLSKNILDCLTSWKRQT